MITKLFFSISFLLLFVHAPFTASAQIQTVIQRGHDQSVLAVAFSPDSNYVATGSRDRTAKLWEVSTGREVRSFLGHEGSVNCIDFSADGKSMITSSGDGSVKIWNVVTGEEVFSTTPSEKVLTAAAFSPDMRFFVYAGYPDEAVVVDYKTKKEVIRIPVNAEQGLGYGINLAFSPNGKWLAIGEDNHVANVYNTASWEKQFTFNQAEGWCGGCATWVAFGFDDASFFMASNKGEVKKYDLNEGTLIKKYGTDIEDIVGLSISKNKILTLVTKKSIVQWHSDSGKEISNPLLSFDFDINEATGAMSGNTILLACADNTALIWDVNKKQVTKKLSGILNEVDKGGVNYNPNSYWESNIAKYLRFKNDVLLSNDGTTLLKGKFGTKVKRWNITTGKTVMEYVGHDKATISYCYSADGSKLLTGGADGKVILWNAANGDSLLVIDAHRDPVFAVHFSHDETKIVSTSWDATLKIFDSKTGKRLTYFDYSNASAYDVAFSANDLYLFTAQLDLTLKMWEIDSKKSVRDFTGHTDVIASIQLSPHGKKLVSASWDGSIRIWDIATGLMDRKLIGHRGAVYKAIWSSDGKQIFSGGADRKVRHWDVNSGKLIHTFEGHQSEVTSIVLEKDATTLISHATDGVTKFWDLTTGKEFFEHIHLGASDWMIKTPDGYFNATDDARRAIHFVNGLKTYAVDQFFTDFYRPELLPQIFKTRGESSTGSIQSKLKNSPPPLVRIAVGNTMDENTLEVFVRLTDEGSGVKTLKLFHNGKSIPITHDFKLPTGKGAAVVYKTTVNLIGGNNIFTASASNRDNVESDAASVEYFSESLSKSSTCYILSVGINDYKNPKMHLNYAQPDAESFSSLLENKSGNLFKAVKLISLYNHEASSEGILAKLDELIPEVQPQDVFIFYYAGHGSMVDNRFFFIPTESIRLYDIKSLQKDAIEASVLQEKLRNIKALKQVIIMDACQSGASVELLATRGASEEKAIAQLSRSAGIHVLASAGSEQFATEFTSLGHGLFTYVLLKALSGEADGAPKDGKVTVYELKSYIDDQVPEMTRQLKGKPQYPYTFSRGQDFPIVISE